jgi:hypothetical protein
LTVSSSPRDKNAAEIDRLEQLLRELRADASTARETEAIREIGLEIALAVRDVGALMAAAGWQPQGEGAEAAMRPRHDGSG